MFCGFQLAESDVLQLPLINEVSAKEMGMGRDEPDTYLLPVELTNKNIVDDSDVYANCSQVDVIASLKLVISFDILLF